MRRSPVHKPVVVWRNRSPALCKEGLSQSPLSAAWVSLVVAGLHVNLHICSMLDGFREGWSVEWYMVDIQCTAELATACMSRDNL